NGGQLNYYFYGHLVHSQTGSHFDAVNRSYWYNWCKLRGPDREKMNALNQGFTDAQRWQTTLEPFRNRMKLLRGRLALHRNVLSHAQLVAQTGSDNSETVMYFPELVVSPEELAGKIRHYQALIYLGEQALSAVELKFQEAVGTIAHHV